MPTRITLGLLALLLSMFLPQRAWCQIAKIAPNQPAWGTTLLVTYDPKADGAKLSSANEIYVAMVMRFYDRSEYRHAKMRRVGEGFTYEVLVEKDLSYITFYFMTLNETDVDAGTMIYRPDGTPVKGAYQWWKVGSDSSLEFLDKEISLYPDNYVAYADKWNWVRRGDRAGFLLVVEKDLEKLFKQVKGEPADYLYALSRAHILMGEEAKSRVVLKKMVELFPTSEFTTRALSNYQARVEVEQIKGEGPEEVEKWKWEIIQRNPNTEFARWNAGAGKLPLAALEELCRQWIRDEPEDPRPYYFLAEAYIKQDPGSEKALSLLTETINYFLKGTLRPIRDYYGVIRRLELPRAYEKLAKISLQRHNYAGALAAVRAGLALAASDADVQQTLNTLEGKIWLELSNYSRAEAAYLEAWRLGSREAEGVLKDLYQKKRGNLVGFEDYLTGKKDVAPTPNTDKKAAPLFTATSLDGKVFDMAALRGKVVVLNFWYIGCAPCEAEMPGLNKLVSEFSGKDVVFLAPTYNEIKDLKPFLKEKRFDYQIIPTEKISMLFQIFGYPAHVIINKEGQIYAMLSGGTPNRHDELRPLIERALNQK